MDDRSERDREPVPRPSASLRTLDDLDGRTRAAKLAQRLVAGLEADLGGGDALSVGARELIKRAALLGAIVEDCEVRWLERKPVDIDTYLAAVNAQRRVLVTVGLDRVPRDVTPDATGQIVESIRGGYA